MSEPFNGPSLGVVFLPAIIPVEAAVRSEANSALAIAVYTFEKQFASVVEWDSSTKTPAIAPNGQRYVECTDLGRRDGSIGYNTFALALYNWHYEASHLFPITPESVLYWRIKPELEYVADPTLSALDKISKMAGWMVYSRFVVGNPTYADRIQDNGHLCIIGNTPTTGGKMPWKDSA